MTSGNEICPVIFVRGPRVSLRPPHENDVPLVVQWLNEPQTRRYLSRVFPLTEAEERKFVEANTSPGGSHLPFIIVDSQTHEPIGCTGMHQIDWVHRRCELGIFLGSVERRGQGLGREAFELLMAYAFEGLNLHRVMLTVYPFNEQGIRCYEAIGFTKEGVDRDSQFVEGRYWDVIRYGMLAREWFARKSLATDRSSD